jgi:quercetin dioxygenase-like cupin family protein
MLTSCKRRTLLQTLAGGLLLGSASSAAEIPSELVLLKDAKERSEAFGTLRLFLDGQTGQLKSLIVGSLQLKPGQAPHPPHTHPDEEVLLVTEGECEIMLEGKTTKAGLGTVMYAPSNRIHGITNTSSSPMTFYYFKYLAK